MQDLRFPLLYSHTIEYRISSKELRGAHLQIYLFPGEGSFHFVYIQTQSFQIVMSRRINATYDEIGNAKKRESVKKPYEHGKVAKQYQGKDYKTMLISCAWSISISLHSGAASTISCCETSLSNGFKSGSLEIVAGLVCIGFILFVIVSKSLSNGAFIRGGRPFEGGALSRKYGSCLELTVFPFDTRFLEVIFPIILSEFGFVIHSFFSIYVSCSG